MASNPRIDDLRKRLEKDPGSRLFAQLAEELRKAGELDDAILVSREGLQKHPAYPSARMTLGRALFDKGALAEARGELEGVLKGAADNILASRLLAECLEGLRDVPGALERYRLTLAMAPGDRQIASKVSALEAKVESAARDAAAPEPAPAPAAAAPTPPEAPIPLVAADEPFELERPYEAVVASPAVPAQSADALPPEASPRVSVAGPEPVLLVPPVAEPAPVLEAMPEPAREAVYDPVPPAALPVAAPAVAASEAAPAGELFEFDGADDPSSVATLKATAPTFEDAPAIPSAPTEPGLVAPPAPPREEPPLLPEMEAEPTPPWVAPVEPPAPEIISSTLAELYFNQGFTEKAIEVYQQVLGREPGNERVRVRLGELQGLEKAPKAEVAAVPAAGDGDGRAARRQALERVIARLEGLRATLRRG